MASRMRKRNASRNETPHPDASEISTHSAIWLHAFLPKRTTDTADAPQLLRSSRFVCKVYHIATGSNFFRFPPQDDASLTPSPTSARCDPSTTPNNQRSACSLAWSLLLSRQPMTAYNLKPPETLPSPAWQEAREKRRTYLQQSADDEQ